MEGQHRSMSISEFEEIVKRNAYAPWDLRFYSSRWGRYQGAPANTCTLIKGNMDNGDVRNVPTPDIPEMSTQDERGYILHRGWRALLKMMCRDRWIQPSPEIERLLGHEDFAAARKGLGCV